MISHFLGPISRSSVTERHPLAPTHPRLCTASMPFPSIRYLVHSLLLAPTAHSTSGSSLYHSPRFCHNVQNTNLRNRDKDAKHRLKGYPNVGGTIPCTDFNRSGSIFAYAVSYDWSKGYSANTPQYPNKVMLHPIEGDEAKPRAQQGLKKR